MMVVVLVLLWLLVGFGFGIYEARRGHWRWLWLVGAIAGPFAGSLTRQLEKNESLAVPLDMSAGSGQGPGSVGLLAGVDGSAESIDAAGRAADLLGSRLGAMTLAMVADFEVHEAVPGPVGPDDKAVHGEREVLGEAAELLSRRVGFEPATVLLSGRPADALHRYASEQEFDVIAVGSRGKGLSKRMLGSCASQLPHGSPVAALIMPPRPDAAEVD